MRPLSSWRGVEGPGVVHQVVAVIAAEEDEELRLGVVDERADETGGGFDVERFGHLLEPNEVIGH